MCPTAERLQYANMIQRVYGTPDQLALDLPKPPQPQVAQYERRFFCCRCNSVHSGPRCSN